MKKIGFLIATFALALLLGAGNANATVISPPLIELEANRGDVLANTIKLKNDGAVAENYYLTVEAFKSTGEDGQASFDATADEAVKWVDFSFTSITLQPGQATTIPFTVKVPQTARSGGHYIAVFASTTPPTSEGSAVGIAARIGSLVLVRVEGETVESARLVEFSTGSDTYSMLPIDFTARVENNGNVHLKPIGEVVVRGIFGNEATRLKLNDAGGNVLPNSLRKYSTVWGQEAPEGFWARYGQQKREELFGKYTAELTLVYGEGKTIKSEVSFWVMPWERIIVDLILLAIIVAILSMLVKRYNAWVVARYNTMPKKK